jgi:hypothetical protein
MRSDSALVLEDRRAHGLVTHTTLYDLIAAINAEVDAEEDNLVIACVVHLLNTQRLTYRGAAGPYRLVSTRPAAPQRRRRTGTSRRRGKGASNAPRVRLVG